MGKDEIVFRAVMSVATAGIALCLVMLGVEVYNEIVEPDSGTITELEYQDDYWYTTCTGGRTNICTSHHAPECWGVYYENNDKKGDACVSEEQWYQYEIGGWYE